MRYVALFILIQLASLVLTLVGIPLCALLAVLEEWEIAHGKPQWVGFWLWSNERDGICGPFPLTRWNAFYWSALRNPCNNLRFVPGVSKVGRPIYRKTWGPKPGGWYFQAGWNPSGFPVFSGGRNVNPW